MKKFKFFTLCLVMILAGCSSAPSEESLNHGIVSRNEGDYGYCLPYVASDAGIVHNLYQNSKNEPYYVGSRLVELAKKHFNPSDYLISEGQFISGEELHRYGDGWIGLGLLMYRSSYNPQGLNPEKGSYIENASGIKMYEPIIVSDVYEIDYVKECSDDMQYAGFSFAIVLNQTVTYKSDPVVDEQGNLIRNDNGDYQYNSTGNIGTLSDEQLFTYGSVEAGQSLVNYLRNNHPEVGNLPIHIALYKASDADSQLPGVYIGESYVVDRASSYNKLQEEWVFAPSARLDELNGIISTQFKQMKNDLFEFFPSNVGIYGRIFFKDNYAKQMNIEVSLQAKTYVEIQSLIEYMIELFDIYQDNSFEIKVNITCNNETVAILTRPANSWNVSFVMN